MFQYVDHYEVVLRQSPFFIDPKIPLDVMGFFSNDEIFLKIDEDTGKLERFQSIEADYNAQRNKRYGKRLMTESMNSSLDLDGDEFKTRISEIIEMNDKNELMELYNSLYQQNMDLTKTMEAQQQMQMNDKHNDERVHQIKRIVRKRWN